MAGSLFIKAALGFALAAQALTGYAQIHSDPPALDKRVQSAPRNTFVSENYALFERVLSGHEKYVLLGDTDHREKDIHLFIGDERTLQLLKKHHFHALMIEIPAEVGGVSLQNAIDQLAVDGQKDPVLAKQRFFESFEESGLLFNFTDHTLNFLSHNAGPNDTEILADTVILAKKYGIRVYCADTDTSIKGQYQSPLLQAFQADFDAFREVNTGKTADEYLDALRDNYILKLGVTKGREAFQNLRNELLHEVGEDRMRADDTTAKKIGEITGHGRGIVLFGAAHIDDFVKYLDPAKTTKVALVAGDEPDEAASYKSNGWSNIVLQRRDVPLSQEQLTSPTLPVKQVGRGSMPTITTEGVRP